MNIKDVLVTLSELSGPSGYERQVSEKAAELLGRYMDNVRIDRLDNVIGEKSCGKTGAKKLLLDAHLDEIGFIVTGIEEGFIRIDSVRSGIDRRLLLAQEVTILSPEPVNGVISCMPPHLMEPGEADKAPEIKDLCVDIGMNQEQAEQAVKIGAPAVFKSRCFELGQGSICGKAIDDRGCFAAILMALDILRGRELNVDLAVLGSVQEEFGAVGATTGAYTIDPDFAIALDVTFAKTPETSRDDTVEYGRGAAVAVGPTLTRWITDRLIETAKAEDIQYQLEPIAGGNGTNAMVIQLSRQGVATGLLSLPLKYMHSSHEVVALDDIEKTARLLAAFVCSFNEEAV